MNLVIDIGNTRTKIGVFSTKNLYFKAIGKAQLEKEIKFLLQHYPQLSKAIVSASGKMDLKGIDLIKEHVKVHLFSPTSVVPFSSNYTTPNTLGLDRKALVAAAILGFPKKNNLIIDLGTCITYDFVDQNHVYFGGAISPGINMRFQSMNNFTANLPLLKKNSKNYKVSFIGDSTEKSINVGVLEGIVMEVQGFIGQYEKKYSDLTVILCGGDANLLAGRLKNSIFANSNFQLKGLNYILEQNLANV